jgi:hypothetical protein
MNFKNVLLAICFLILGIAIGYYIATHRPSSGQTIAMHFNEVGDMIVNGKAGDHLEFYGSPHQKIPVTFKYNMKPCRMGDPGSGTCTLKDNAVYVFNCTGCDDPGVGGGDYTVDGLVAAALVHLDPPYANPKTANVYCDDGTSTAMADTVYGTQNDGFAMQLVGSTTDFTATFPSGTCLPSDTLTGAANGPSPTCRIQPVVSADISYKIMVTGCAKPGTGKLSPPKK